MNDIQISRLLKPIKTFIGIFSANTIPKDLFNNKNKCFIFNTDPSNLPGRHWIAVYVQNKNKIEYFDSYGKIPKLPIFSKRIQHIHWNKKRLQSPYSTICGEYCIYYLLKRHNISSMKKVFNTFIDKKYYDNDSKIITYITKYFGKRYKREDDCYSIFTQICSPHCKHLCKKDLGWLNYEKKNHIRR